MNIYAFYCNKLFDSGKREIDELTIHFRKVEFGAREGNHRGGGHAVSPSSSILFFDSLKGAKKEGQWYNGNKRSMKGDSDGAAPAFSQTSHVGVEPGGGDALPLVDQSVPRMQSRMPLLLCPAHPHLSGLSCRSGGDDFSETGPCQMSITGLPQIQRWWRSQAKRSADDASPRNRSHAGTSNSPLSVVPIPYVA